MSKGILPRFKDKVMYINNGEEKSYTISSSFKGIIRLSPNNNNSIYEKVGIQASLLDINNLTSNYSDSIKFDSDVSSAFKSNADISKRMLIASDSDGYLTSFRISENNLEFDSLGVIGVIKANNLTLFTKAETHEEDVFLLNGERMPILPKKNPTYSKLFSSSAMTTELSMGDYDVREIKITNIPDESEILYSSLSKDNKRFWKYKKSSTFIQDLIIEALLDLETVPTGSIHWFPVTLEQFNILVTENGNLPNVTHNKKVANKEVEPIVRDFLLCDGRKYNNKDFPELAKILWKEPINKWKACDNNNNILYPFFDTECNKYGTKNQEDLLYATAEDYTFTVPDLRHQFISSIYVDGTTSVEQGRPINATSVKSGTGTWTIDNNSSSVTDSNADNHRHFIAYGTYDISVSNPKEYFRKGSDYSVSGDDYWCRTNMPNSIKSDLINNGTFDVLANQETVHITTLTNNIEAQYIKDAPDANSRWVIKGFGQGSKRHHQQEGSGGYPAPIIFSAPSDNVGWGPNIDLGMSSYDVDSCVFPNSYNEIDNNFSSSISNNEEYVDWNTISTHFYSHENNPKYYAFLPFIKI